MKWIITKDHIDADRVGTRSIDWMDTDRIEDMPHKFRLYDDDGTLCFEGVYDKATIDDNNPDEEFDPLEWAMGDAGCTYMTYWSKKDLDWVQL